MNKCAGYIIVFVVVFFFLGGLFVEEFLYEEGKVVSSLEVALQSAGDNRLELEKVLRRYQQTPSDSLKYKAACFLIENMPFYAYSAGEQLENYKSYYAWLKKNEGRAPQQVADSVKKVFGPMTEPERKHDIREVDSAYLCNNIDWAFKVWQEQPWGKNISFDVFCEYVLPYRIEDEPLTYWREMYYNKKADLNDEIWIFDWEGSPIKKLKINNKLICFCVDEIKGNIYCIMNAPDPSIGVILI